MNNKKFRAIIVDLDDCLFENTELNKYLPKDCKSREQWDEFGRHLHKVKPQRWCVNIVKKFTSTHTVLFVTSREDIGTNKEITVESITEALTNGYMYTPFRLFMRKANDFRPSPDVKRDIYFTEIHEKYDIELAIDDDLDNAMMWDSLGIPSLMKLRVKELADAEDKQDMPTVLEEYTIPLNF